MAWHRPRPATHPDPRPGDDPRRVAPVTRIAATVTVGGQRVGPNADSRMTECLRLALARAGTAHHWPALMACSRRTDVCRRPLVTEGETVTRRLASGRA